MTIKRAYDPAGLIGKAAGDGSADEFNFVLSSAATDRHGDTIDQSSWNLKNFKKNPIALWQHNANVVIGKWADVRVEGNKLLGRLVMAARGTSRIVDELRSLLEQDILKAVSVGFMPGEEKPRKGGGWAYSNAELFEVSLVSVPAHPDALRKAMQLNLSDELINQALRDTAITRRSIVSDFGDPATNRPRAGRSTQIAKIKEMIQ